MATREIVLTEDEYRLVSIWANNAWHDADQKRMLSRIGSPQEKACEADQEFIGAIQRKLAGRESVSPTLHP